MAKSERAAGGAGLDGQAHASNQLAQQASERGYRGIASCLPLPAAIPWSGVLQVRRAARAMARDGLCQQLTVFAAAAAVALQTVGRGMPRPPSHEKLSRQCGAQDEVDRMPTSKEDDE